MRTTFQRSAFAFCLMLTAASMFSFPAAAEPTPMEECHALTTMDGVGPVCPREDGLYEVFAPDGSSLGFVHGTDPRCHGCEEPISLQGSTAPHCVSGASGTYYIHVIYARASNDADRYATMAPQIRTLVQNSNAMVDDAAIATGDTVKLRVLCSGTTIVVENEVLPTPRASASFSTIVDDLRDLGYNDHRQKYWVYYDDASACACAGTGHLYNDDSNSVNNYNNGNSNAIPMFAVSFDSNSVRTMLHELGHNLGAVQNSAPHSTGAGHCTDGRDTMCYNDGGPNAGNCTPDFYCSNSCSVEVFDCGKNTYFHANPTSGSYLATHWQVGSRLSRFLTYGGGTNAAPTMTSLSCSPNPSTPGQSVTCSFSASDDSTGVYYMVDWGDGSADTRVPSSGHVTPGTTQSASHSWSSAGSYTVSVTATDNAATPLTSSPRTTTQTVQAANAAPVMQSLSCSPNPSTPGQSVTCSFYATDSTSTGVYYMVDWGDGSADTRVPSSGFVTPGTTQSASHSWSSAGSYTVSVTATDNGSPPLTSTARTTTQTVQAANAAPVMQLLSCSPNPSTPGQSVTCSFYATDTTSTGVYYMIDWGDGSANTRVPSSGYVTPGTSQSASHTWSAAGSYTVSVTATDNGSPPLTSTARTTTQTVQVANAAPVMQSLSCSPNPSTTAQSVTCSFHATDSTSTGVYYMIDWGDGSSTRVPSSGFVTPGTSQSASHAWSSAGSYTVSVTATDNGSPPLTSSPMTTTQTVNAPNEAPVMQSLSCSPNPSTVGQTVTCSFYATDSTSSGVYYMIDWGDGSADTRVPSSGYVSPGTSQSASHAWSSAGPFTVSVTATDDEAPALTSSAKTTTQTVQTANAAPVMQSLSCSPNPSTTGQSVTCDFHASDATSSAVYYTVQWGDGSPSTRVPALGYVSPGTSQSASHAWSSTGTYPVSVTATDSGSPALTSPAMSHSQEVEPPNAAPTMDSLSCSPNPSEVGQSVTCSFQASDSTSNGIYYTVDWGDGQTTRVPSSGYVAPGTSQSASHAWSSAGTKSVSVTATDNGSPPLTSAASTVSQQVEPANEAPTMTSLSCSPDPSTPGESVTCSFSASDDGGSVYYEIDWGDGSPAQRVPASGYVAAGSVVTRSHAWSATGAYTVSVTATDDETPAKTSAPLTHAQTVQPPPNAAPTMQSLSCPATAHTGAQATCTFSATDDGSQIYYTVDWGDGTTTRVPSSGYVAPGTSQSASHTWTTTGAKVVRVSATDDASPPLTSAQMTKNVNVVPPPCVFSRTGSLLVGLGGEEIDGVSSRMEYNVPSACHGKFFTLTGSQASDFNVCWLGAAGQTLSCANALGNDTGFIPAGTVHARVTLFAGANASYDLTAAT